MKRIGFQTRYFIPAEKDTAKILDEVIKISPVSRVEHGKECLAKLPTERNSATPNDRVAAKSCVAKQKPSVLETLERNAQKSRAMFGGGKAKANNKQRQGGSL